MNRALLIGINAYPAKPLRGCVNDVTDMAQFLVTRCGFKEGEVRLLTDDRATTEGIRERLQWLLGGVSAGDRVLFHYSGHGARFALRSTSGVVNKIHDVICPVDFDFTPEHTLTDEDLRQVFSAIPAGVEFNWVSDSCCSGDLARALNAPTTRSYPVPADLEWRNRTAEVNGLQPLGFERAFEHLNGALIAGCKSTQTSADAIIDGRANGALTYFLLKVLSGAGGQTAPLTKVVEKVRAALRPGYEQVPQLRGSPAVTALPFLAVPSAKSARGESAPAEVEREVELTVKLERATVGEALEKLAWATNSRCERRDGQLKISAAAGAQAPVVSGTVNIGY